MSDADLLKGPDLDAISFDDPVTDLGAVDLLLVWCDAVVFARVDGLVLELVLCVDFSSLERHT